MWLEWYWAVAITVVCSAAALVVRLSAPRLHSVLRETAVLSLLYTAWRIAGRVSVIHPEGAYERADWLWDLERTLRLPSEAVWQEMILGSSWLVKAANIYYAGAHVPLMGVFLVWLFFRHRERYAPWRNTLAASTLACVAVQLLPLAPPRLMPEFGLVDTPHLYGQSVYQSAGASLSGQLQAMPSIHVGWAALIGWSMLSVERRWVRWLGLVHALLTMWVVVVTGNHYWLDGVVAIAILVVIGMALGAHRGSEARPGPEGRSDPTPSSVGSTAPPTYDAPMVEQSRVRFSGSKIVLVVVLAFAMSTFGVATASADAVLLGSSPEQGAVYGSPVETLEFQFNETITFPEVELDTPDGRTLSGVIQSRREGNIYLTLSEPETATGRYVVRYEVVSVDGDPVGATITFDVDDSSAPMQALPTSLTAQRVLPGQHDGSRRSPLFLVALGVSIALGAILIWTAFDRLSRRIRDSNDPDTASS